MFPPEAATAAGRVDALYIYLVVISTVMTALIFLCVAFFAVRYRRRDPDEIPRPNHGSIVLETIWSVVPFLFMLVMFAWGTKLYFENYTPPKDTLDVYVVGKQWMWKIQYPDGQREINELHVPTGRPVKLVLASEDVIHSFYIPSFRLKHDVVPGSYQTYWFEATQPGRYHIFCAEYCGTNHSRMIGWVTVMDPAAYQNWLQSGATQVPMREEGQKLFAQFGCAGCHDQQANGPAPSLNNVFGHPVQLASGGTATVDETFLRQSILNPQSHPIRGYPANAMPVYQGQINEEQLLDLMVYIKSLSGPQSGQAGGTNPEAPPATRTGAKTPGAKQ
jgi:cytochrome c oxidase subunit 2